MFDFCIKCVKIYRYRRDIMDKKERLIEIHNLLKIEYPDAKCSLITENNLQLLISTELSAQFKDERVNEVTQNLYQRYLMYFILKMIQKMGRSSGLDRNISFQAQCCSIFLKFITRSMEPLIISRTTMFFK